MDEPENSKNNQDARFRPSLEAVRAEIEILKEREAKRREFKETVCGILLIIMGILLLNLYVVRLASVNGASIEPTLYSGDIVVCSPLGYRPDYGDIVITKMSAGEGPLIKRIIALPGDTVDIDFEKGTVLVNGTELEETYISDTIKQKGDVQFPVTVPEGRVFLLGDNRNNSLDSRYSVVGMVPQCTLMGHVFYRIFPFNRMGRL